MLKKLISLLIFLLTIQLVLADDLNIDLIQYDTSLNIARIQISNKGETTYHNVSLSIDNMPSKFVVDRLRPKAAVIKTEVVSPTKHTITVSTDEKTFSKELHFAKPEDVVAQELKQIEEEQNKTKQLPKPRGKKPILSRTAKQTIFLIFFLLIIILTIFIIRKKLFRKTKTRISIQKPLAQPLRKPIPSKILRKRIQEREKERKRILQSLTPTKRQEPIKTYKKEQKTTEKKIVKREIPEQEIKLKEQPKQKLPKEKRAEPDILKKLRGISKEK